MIHETNQDARNSKDQKFGTQDPMTGEAFPLVYAELHRIARRQRRASHDLPNLDTTDLVHETYLKLLKSPQVARLNRNHFFAVAARAMRQVLIDQARRRNFRRFTGEVPLSPEDENNVASTAQPPVDVIALDRALQQLCKLDPRAGQTVEWRAFGGLGIAEIAALQGVNARTVNRDWRRGCAYLLCDLNISKPCLSPVSE